MRKVIVCNMMSLDGYYEAPGRNVMSLFAYRDVYQHDESFDAYNAQRLRAAGMLLLGRDSYVGFKSYWPSVAENPNATAPTRAVSRRMNAISKVVVSDTLQDDDTEPWRSTTRIVSQGDARGEVARLKRERGRDILICASRTLWHALSRDGLVDELHLMISPVVLGAGTPLFASPPGFSLLRLGTRTWKGGGTVLVRYSLRGHGS